MNIIIKQFTKILGSCKKYVRTILISELQRLRSSAISKREILGLCNRAYDPIGMVLPYTIKLKLLIRENSPWFIQ